MSRTPRRLDLAIVGLVIGLAVLLGCATRDEPVTTVSADPTPESLADATNEPPLADDERNIAGDERDVDGDGPTFHPDENPELLSDWGQVVLAGQRLALGNGVVPYELNSALFSDHAQKLRTVWLPDGASPARYDDTETFGFPVGTVITKTFWYPVDDGPDRVRTARAMTGELQTGLDLGTVRLVETRILVHRAEGWHALPYVWNDEQTEAVLQRTGDLLRLTLVDEASGEETDFPYVVPNVNQCAGCHATNHTEGEILPIGPKARHLNRTVDFDDGRGVVEQLSHWQALGLVAVEANPGDAPKNVAWDDPSAPLDERARAYLDINCAHCHNEAGPADTSGLFLEPSNPINTHLGVCKPPVAAGTGTGDRRFGINPGVPEDSIFVFRMQTTDPGSMMPELGRALPHADGIDLITEWIASLDGTCD